jgi:type III secretory pathway component EscR
MMTLDEFRLLTTTFIKMSIVVSELKYAYGQMHLHNYALINAMSIERTLTNTNIIYRSGN